MQGVILSHEKLKSLNPLDHEVKHLIKTFCITDSLCRHIHEENLAQGF